MLSRSTRSDSWNGVAQSVGVGVIAGIMAGLIVGAVSRLAMRIVALVADDPLEFTVKARREYSLVFRSRASFLA